MQLIYLDQDLAVPGLVSKHILGVNLITYGSEIFPYLIMSREFWPELRGFVSYNDGLPFISEEVPREYRKYVILHELIEFRELRGLKGRCEEALKRELVFVFRDVKVNFTRYGAYRIAFFQRLESYYSKPGRGSSLEFRNEIAGSLRYLEAL